MRSVSGDLNIDWQQLTLNLRAYKSLRQIAIELDAHYDTIKELALGRSTNPRFNLAVKLLDLHYDKCRDRHNFNNLGTVKNG